MYQKLNGFVGAAYTLDSVNVESQRCLNLYPEQKEAAFAAKGNEQYYLKATSGMVEIDDLNDVLDPVSWPDSDTDVGTDSVLVSTHGLLKNIKGQLTSTGTLPAGLNLATDYYVVYDDADNIGFSLTKNGSKVNITDIGSGTHTFTPSAYTTTGCRLIHYDGANRILIVFGDRLYSMVYSGGTYTATLRGILDSTTGVVRAATTTLTGNSTMLVDGTDNYIFYGTNNSFGKASSGGYSVPTNPTDITWLDNYLVVTLANSGVFMSSDVASFNFDALSFSSAEGDPDDVVGLIANHRDLWVFGERSTEVYVNTGNPDFPFERTQGGFIEVGCLAKASIKKAKGSIFWLGRDRTGQGSVYMSKGLGTQRISTHAIEQAIAGYADPSAATAYAYEWKGHVFYVLNFAEATWVYDMTTSLWHERGFTSGGTVGRHLAALGDFFPDSGRMILGHYNDDKIYYFDDSVYVDGGATDYITRQRTFPYLSNTLEGIICDRLQIDMETGVGLVSGQGSDPQMMLDWSDDGGHTWSDEAWTSAGGQVGGIGEYSTRVIWRRLGRFRQRIFRLKTTEPVSITLIDAFMKIRQTGN